MGPRTSLEEEEMTTKIEDLTKVLGAYAEGLEDAQTVAELKEDRRTTWIMSKLFEYFTPEYQRRKNISSRYEAIRNAARTLDGEQHLKTGSTQIKFLIGYTNDAVDITDKQNPTYRKQVLQDSGHIGKDALLLEGRKSITLVNLYELIVADILNNDGKSFTVPLQLSTRRYWAPDITDTIESVESLADKGVVLAGQIEEDLSFSFDESTKVGTVTKEQLKPQDAIIQILTNAGVNPITAHVTRNIKVQLDPTTIGIDTSVTRFFPSGRYCFIKQCPIHNNDDSTGE